MTGPLPAHQSCCCLAVTCVNRETVRQHSGGLAPCCLLRSREYDEPASQPAASQKPAKTWSYLKVLLEAKDMLAADGEPGSWVVPQGGPLRRPIDPVFGLPPPAQASDQRSQTVARTRWQVAVVERRSRARPVSCLEFLPLSHKAHVPEPVSLSQLDLRPEEHGGAGETFPP